MRLDEAARQYIDVPFLHQGRDPAVGIDCIGLGQLACRDAGLTLPDWADYSENPHGGLLEGRLIELFGPPLPLSEIRPGDIVAVSYGGALRHVAIVGSHRYGDREELMLIHTDSRKKKVVEHRLTEGWLGRKPPAIGMVFRPEIPR